MTRGRIVGGVAGLVVAGIGVWAYSDLESSGGPRRAPPPVVEDRPPHLDVTGDPLFVHGDLYLDGRSRWFLERFDADLETFAAFSKLLANRLDGVPPTEIDLHGIALTGYDIAERETTSEGEDDEPPTLDPVKGGGGGSRPGASPRSDATSPARAPWPSGRTCRNSGSIHPWHCP